MFGEYRKTVGRKWCQMQPGAFSFDNKTVKEKQLVSLSQSLVEKELLSKALSHIALLNEKSEIWKMQFLQQSESKKGQTVKKEVVHFLVVNAVNKSLWCLLSHQYHVCQGSTLCFSERSQCKDMKPKSVPICSPVPCSSHREFFVGSEQRGVKCKLWLCIAL